MSAMVVYKYQVDSMDEQSGVRCWQVPEYWGNKFSMGSVCIINVSAAFSCTELHSCPVKHLEIEIVSKSRPTKEDCECQGIHCL